MEVSVKLASHSSAGPPASDKCYLCGAPGSNLYSDVVDRLCSAPGHWSLRQCTDSRCGLVFLHPMPRESEIPSLYPSDYSTHTTRQTGATPRQRNGIARLGQQFTQAYRAGIRTESWGIPSAPSFGRWQQFAYAAGRMRAKLPLLSGKLGEDYLWIKKRTSDAALLDIGCGNGEFLARMRSVGWKVAGVDPDPAAVQIAREQHELTVFQGLLEHAALPAEQSDVVTMVHVIEHLADPIRTLRQAYQHLRPGGRLVVITPNTKSLCRHRFGRHWVGWDIPRHLHLFTPASLIETVQRAGFQVHRLSTSSRTAPWAWYVSEQIKRNGKCSDSPHPSYTRRSRFWGRLVRFLEWLSHPVVKTGEELVLVAVKPANAVLAGQEAAA